MLPGRTFETTGVLSDPGGVGMRISSTVAVLGEPGLRDLG